MKQTKLQKYNFSKEEISELMEAVGIFELYFNSLDPAKTKGKAKLLRKLKDNILNSPFSNSLEFAPILNQIEKAIRLIKQDESLALKAKSKHFENNSKRGGRSNQRALNHFIYCLSVIFTNKNGRTNWAAVEAALLPSSPVFNILEQTGIAKLLTHGKTGKSYSEMLRKRKERWESYCREKKIQNLGL